MSWTFWRTDPAKTVITATKLEGAFEGHVSDIVGTYIFATLLVHVWEI